MTELIVGVVFGSLLSLVVRTEYTKFVYEKRIKQLEERLTRWQKEACTEYMRQAATIQEQKEIISGMGDDLLIMQEGYHDRAHRCNS